MEDWLHNLPFWWMSLVVSVIVVAGSASICIAITMLSRADRTRIFKSVSIGLLSPLGTIFGLLVVFILAQVWSDMDRAEVAVDREASSLRTVILLAASFPGEPEQKFRMLVRRHIDEAVSVEWPAMEKHAASLNVASSTLAEALQLALSLTPKSEGQIVAQREIIVALEAALDARRQRIILSGSSVNWIKWTCLFAQTICVLVTIAMAHSDNRIAAAIAVGIFAVGVAVSVSLIASHDQPFKGVISIKPDLLLQVRPEQQTKSCLRS